MKDENNGAKKMVALLLKIDFVTQTSRSDSDKHYDPLNANKRADAAIPKGKSDKKNKFVQLATKRTKKWLVLNTAVGVNLNWTQDIQMN